MFLKLNEMFLVFYGSGIWYLFLLSLLNLVLWKNVGFWCCLVGILVILCRLSFLF